MKKILTQYGVCALAVALMVTLAQAQTQTPAPGTSFRDCSNGCPEMMVVQQGRFTMGAPAGEEARENLPNELRGSSVPQHLINQNFAGIGRSSRGITNAANTIFSEDSGMRARWNCDGASAGCRLHAAFGRIPVPSCVSIAIPPGLQTIAFHNPSSFKEEKCL